MKDKKIVFMGGKHVGYKCLEFLIQNGYQTIGCYINSDDTATNRWYDSLTELCLRQGIPVFYFANVNSVESEKTIRQLAPDVITVVYYDQILHENIIDLPKIGCTNLHLALSQVHRGCYPTTWSLIRGDTHTGATFHFIVPKIDGGPVIAQKKLKIKDYWTGKDLYANVSDVGIKLFKEFFPKLDRIKPHAIDISKSQYYRKEFPSREVKLNKSTYNYVRSLIFDPFPPPYIKIGNRIFTINEMTLDY
ncbi:MAG: formyltransferase family protein [Candidatus Gottesmanbacteria bacterium]|nr:formyltransferase family protein [Candidatus Gottesmanbacteria bacterium]